MHSDQRRIGHLAFIDGLRAVAVLSVLASHLYGPLLPGGFAGVDVFFVISGFVVSASVSHFQEPTLWSFLSYFYARRIARILPALVFFLLVTLFVAALFIPPGWLSQNYQLPGLYAFFGVSNFVLARSASDYFSPVADFNPFTHTWSLGVEEQFYLVFPVLFIGWLWPRRRMLSLGLVCTVSMLSLAAAAAHIAPSGQSAYYLPWQRLWELGLGVLTFQLCSLFREKRTWVRPAACCGISLVSAAVLAFGLLHARASDAPFPAVLLPAFGTAGLLASLFLSPKGIIEWALTQRSLRYIGKISYSLYLWHWGVFVLFRWTLGLSSTPERILALASSFALAIFSYSQVENRFRNLGRLPQKWKPIFAGVSCVIVAFALGRQIELHQEGISLSTVVHHKSEWYADLEYDRIGDCSLKTDTSLVGGGLLWTYARAADCAKPVSFPHRVFVAGDSHAMHYRRMLSRLAIETGATVYAYNNGGCPVFGFLPLEKSLVAACAKYTEAALADIRERGRKDDVLVLSSLRTPRLMDQWAHLYSLRDALASSENPSLVQIRREQEKEAGVVLGEMTRRGMIVVFVAPSGLSPRVNYRCADWFNRMNPICADGDSFPRATLDALRQPALASFSVIQHRLPRVFTWDPFYYLCPSATCSSTQHGKPIYFDSDHLSAYSNDILYAPFAHFLRGIEGSATIDENDIPPDSPAGQGVHSVHLR